MHIYKNENIDIEVKKYKIVTSQGVGMSYNKNCFP